MNQINNFFWEFNAIAQFVMFGPRTQPYVPVVGPTDIPSALVLNPSKAMRFVTVV